MIATQAQIDCPAPGVYRNIPFEDYLAWPAVSNSRITMARRSLLHFKEQVIKDTPNLFLGRFTHCGVLEPLWVSMRYAVMPPYELDAGNCTAQGKPSTAKTTKYYEAKERAFREANEGKEIVDQATFDMLVGVTRSLMKSERASQYLTERGEAEVSLVWIDPETQLRCKARIDLLNSGINDLKTCADAMKFPRSIAEYGYHRQGAFYRAGWSILNGGEILPFRLIAVEKTRPYGVRAAPLNEDALDMGEEEVRRALRDIAGAYKSNKWPCYDDPSSWCLPSFYVGDDEPVELTIGGQTVTI